MAYLDKSLVKSMPKTETLNLTSNNAGVVEEYMLCYTATPTPGSPK